ncbi:uncharacterized protein LOC110851837 [Folsomia candida]|nr:uncharacterized protein LOC110851837 [Folsomia candida]
MAKRKVSKSVKKDKVSKPIIAKKEKVSRPVRGKKEKVVSEPIMVKKEKAPKAIIPKKEKAPKVIKAKKEKPITAKEKKVLKPIIAKKEKAEEPMIPKEEIVSKSVKKAAAPKPPKNVDPSPTCLALAPIEAVPSTSTMVNVTSTTVAAMTTTSLEPRQILDMHGVTEHKEEEYMEMSELDDMSTREKNDRIRCLEHEKVQQAGQLELSVGTVGVLESNMQIWHKRLVDKENEVEKLNKVVRDINDSFRIEWKSETSNLLLTNTLQNSKEQKFYYENGYEARMEENKSNYDKNLLNLEKDRKRLVKENKKLVQDAKNREAAFIQALTVERKRVVFLAKQIPQVGIPSFSSNPGDDEVVNVVTEYGDLLRGENGDDEEGGGEDDFQVVLDNGQVVEFKVQQDWIIN